jgi:hypothetical protein
LVQSTAHVGSLKEKLIQFASIFHSLNDGRPMIEFEMLKYSYGLLGLKNDLRKYWIDTNGQGMAKGIYMMSCWKTQKLLCKNLSFFL